MEDTKSLQKGSKYNEYDEDGDGIVTDEELRHVKEIKEVEHNLRKQRAQRDEWLHGHLSEWVRSRW